MESRAPLIYFEHAGKFEQMDGDCYDDDPADFPSVSWRLGGPQSEKGDGSQSNALRSLSHVYRPL
jgi:hypothetical protein